MYANRQIVKYISKYVKRIRFISEEGAVPQNVVCIEDDLLNYIKLSKLREFYFDVIYIYI